MKFIIFIIFIIFNTFTVFAKFAKFAKFDASTWHPGARRQHSPGSRPGLSVNALRLAHVCEA
jgi:hypothetical protein